MKDKSLYIHIPFCNNICFYCDFNKVFYNSDLASRYVDCLIKDLENDFDTYKTIYIGGGSPSSLSTKLLEKLLKALNKNIQEDTEFTIEINPNDIDINKVKILSKYHVNRVSIGVQTFNEKLLKYLNRNHSNLDVYNAVKMLKENGINNINCDLIFGIENQSNDDLINDINKLIELGANHISTYALLIEKNTYFDVKNIKAIDDEKQAEQFELICSYLYKNKYIHYEVSNFCLNGYESKHNLIYWRAKEYKALGAGASGYENGVRYTYTRSIEKYINSHEIVEKEVLNFDDLEYEFIILNLRLNSGIYLEEFKSKFNVDFKVKYKEIINKLLKKNLIEISDEKIRVKESKFFILNQVLSYF